MSSLRNSATIRRRAGVYETCYQCSVALTDAWHAAQHQAPEKAGNADRDHLSRRSASLQTSAITLESISYRLNLMVRPICG
jgi:hypothetical protein